MKKIGVSEEQVQTLSYAVSEYVNSLGERDWIEGIFIMPCGEESVKTIVLGIVYNDWRMGKCIQQSNKGRLYGLSYGVGISLQVKDVSIDKCFDDFEYCLNTDPIKGMIKSGVVIYDVNGRLRMLQEAYKEDTSIASFESIGAVEMEPVIQYSKKIRFY